MKRLVAALAFLLALSAPAFSQAIVITSCGTVPSSIGTLVLGHRTDIFVDVNGQLCTNATSGGGAVTQSGTWTMQPGNTPNTTPWLFSQSQGGNTAVVKPASTTPLATDPAAVVAISPNSAGIVPLGRATGQNSIPFVPPSDVVVGSPSGAVVGSYCMAQASGTMAAGLAGGAPIVSWRYGGANIALVRKIKFSLGDTATAFTAGVFTFQTLAARSFTVSDTGGTAATITGNNGKLRTSFATTGISDFRTSSTATLTAGTRTLDAAPLSSVSTSDPATAGQSPLSPVDLFRQEMGEQPLQIAQNEGFVVQATVPATGTWTFSVQVCWDEVSAY